jgi:hypothetical protein
MRRLFWVTLGAVAGIVVVRKLSRTAEQLAPSSLVREVARFGDSVRYFGDEVRAGMAEREQELRDALGLSETPVETKGRI